MNASHVERVRRALFERSAGMRWAPAGSDAPSPTPRARRASVDEGRVIAIAARTRRGGTIPAPHAQELTA